MIKFHKCSDTAIIPTRGTEGSAGFYLYSEIDFILHAGCSAVIPTGIATEFSSDFAGQIWPRSGLAEKFQIDVLAGIIDSDYTGEIKVILKNHGNSEIHAFKGMRIAQIVFVRVCTNAVEADSYLTETERGNDGFGSTGK